ncbi:sigma factor-like helix-turn-helix DNA-binding protein [Streptomyces sp. NPDC004393]|uniref:sigma factor-like helix-turn-helix DNA-binding protein n=1 Tax=Streptomyces sp. NPDC004533 TaxID=3154278 RepID=UPI0033B1E6B9
MRELRRRDAHQYALAAEEARRISGCARTEAGDVAVEVTDRHSALQALASLPEADRELLTLIAWQGLSAKAAAQVLDCTTATLTVRLSGAPPPSGEGPESGARGTGGVRTCRRGPVPHPSRRSTRVKNTQKRSGRPDVMQVLADARPDGLDPSRPADPARQREDLARIVAGATDDRAAHELGPRRRGSGYHRSGAFTVGGPGLEGESLAGSFDYVIAINYNRQPGTSPTDGIHPMGRNRGGGIWIHVDHGGPTHACVSLSRTHMKQLLRALDPADHPVVVMGDADSLAR